MKRILSSTLAGIFLLAVMAPFAFAVGDNPYEDLLLEMGIPEEIISLVPESTAKELVKKYQENPESVQVSTSTMETDPLSDMHEFVRKSNAELRKEGYSEKQISKGRSIIEKYNKASNQELLDAGLTEADIHALRMALNPNWEGTISPQQEISKAKLTFTQVKSDYCTSDMANTFIEVYFNWTTPYFWDTYTDQIAISWGGSLKHVEDFQNAQYYNTNLAGTQYTTLVGGSTPSYNEKVINGGGVYIIPQNYSRVISGKSGVVKTGRFRYEIYQYGFEGKATKAIAYYLHQVAKTTGTVQIGVGGALPGVQFGQGYDSAYVESTIRY